ncbi:hypothetical protein Vafri_20954 [Volvox africanus]|uniref:Uncharacterized protein n=1 Tax=Volvox africanus TaxID=51714 RepID=A0A8J4FEG1_9CHLO|nr:hypothetical protein Vafri_20954 [Volvox africanus]
MRRSLQHKGPVHPCQYAGQQQSGLASPGITCMHTFSTFPPPPGEISFTLEAQMRVATSGPNAGNIRQCKQPGHPPSRASAIPAALKPRRPHHHLELSLKRRRRGNGSSDDYFPQHKQRLTPP